MISNNSLEQRYQRCLSILETQANLEQLEFVLSELTYLGDYQSAKRLLVICIDRIEELKSEQSEIKPQPAEQSLKTQRIIKDKKNKKIKTPILLICISCVLISVLAIVSIMTRNSNKKLLIGTTFSGSYQNPSEIFRKTGESYSKHFFTIKILDDTYCEIEYTKEINIFTRKSNDNYYSMYGSEAFDYDKKTQTETVHTTCKYQMYSIWTFSFFNWVSSDDIPSSDKIFEVTIVDGKLALQSKGFQSGYYLTLSAEGN